MKGLDLRKFKKLHSNDHTTTLVHPDGHQIKIAHKNLKPDMRKSLDGLQKFESGGSVLDQPTTDQGMTPVDPASIDTTSIMASPTAPVGPADPGAMQAAQTVDRPPAEPNVNMPAPQQSTPPSLQHSTDPMQEAAAMQMAGVQGEANATSAQGKKEAIAADKQVADMEQLNKSYQQQHSEITAEIDNATHDFMNGHIDPKHFFNSQSDMGKVSTAIGLILGGMGGGLTGQENPALKFLNQQIDRDIDAQKMNMSKQGNLIKILQDKMGNMRDATTMAKSIYAGIYTAKLEKAAAESKDPMAQARAMQAKGQIAGAIAPAIQEMALRQSVLQGLRAGSVTAAQAVPVLVPKEHQAAAFKETGQAENMKDNEQAIMDNFDAAAKKNTVLRRAAHLGAEPAELTNVRNMLMPVLKDNEGRVNETEIKLMEDFLPKAGDTDEKIAIKRKALMQFTQAKKATPTLNAHGINAPQMSTQKATPRK